MGPFNAEAVFSNDPNFLFKCEVEFFRKNYDLKLNNLCFTEMRWERGDITFLYKGDSKTPEESLFVLDNKLRVYQKVS